MLSGAVQGSRPRLFIYLFYLSPELMLSRDPPNGGFWLRLLVRDDDGRDRFSKAGAGSASSSQANPGLVRSAWLVAAVVRVDRAGRGSRRPPGATAGRLADQRQQQHVAAVAGRRRRAAGAKACKLLPACVRDVVSGRGGRDPSLARRTARYAA